MRGFAKSAVALIAAAVLTFAAAAVTLHRGNQNDPDTLDPHKSTGSWESNILGDLMLGLTTEDAAANPIPGAAESWTVSDDGLVWTFKMRKGALWSDGVPVTAQDFVYSFRRQLDPATASQYASMMYDIEGAEAVNTGKAPLETLGVTAIDAGTLEMRLVHPAPYLPQLLMHQINYPVPEHVVEKLGDDWSKPGNYVSNGPFTLASWRPNDHVTLEKNPRFYDAANVKIDEVVFYPTDDSEAALKRFRTGDLDLNIGFPSQQIDYLRKTMAAELHVATLVNVRYIAMNLKRPAFQDIRVRRAIALAINREKVASEILRAGEQPAYSLVPPGTAGYDDGPIADFKAMPMAERIAEAKRLLAETGYGPGHPLTFQYRYIGDPDSRRMAAALQGMWAAVGIQVDVSVSEKKIHYNTVRAGDYDVSENNWFGDYNDAKNFLFLTQPSADEMNVSKYASQDYERLIRASDQERDAGKRAALMKQAEALMLADTPITPVFYGVSRNLVHIWVKGWEDNLLNVHRSRFMSIEGRDTGVAAQAGKAAPAAAAADAGRGGDRPWYWWLAAAWDWFLGLLCAWFGVACPAG
ncbi:MAG: peptide ABC transporter substrate-binding protein [Alphaproteobacteria bacterium]|nr:peptide ABC transporter substrate-binding protein [Alphaproteobacteria bacterium]